MDWYPKKKLGIYAFWISIAAWIIMLVPALLLDTANAYINGLAFLAMLLSGVLAYISFFKQNDKAILLIIPALSFLFTIYFVLGELFSPH